MAKARQEKWIMCRLRRETHRKLLDLERSWVDAYTKGDGSVPAPDDRDGISIDRMVSELHRRLIEHRARSKRSSSHKRRQGAAGGMEEGGTAEEE